MSFYNWIDTPTDSNTLRPTDFVTDTQRASGFQSGEAASSLRVNTALRQANLVAVAMMNAIVGDSNLNFRSSLEDVYAAINNGLASKIAGTRVNNAKNVTDAIANNTLDQIFVMSGANVTTKVQNAANADNATTATNATNVTGTIGSNATATTQQNSDNSTKVSTTEFVQNLMSALTTMNNSGSGTNLTWKTYLFGSLRIIFGNVTLSSNEERTIDFGQNMFVSAGPDACLVSSSFITGSYVERSVIYTDKTASSIKLKNPSSTTVGAHFVLLGQKEN